MAIMDPLLNTGFLWRCLAAYAGIKSDSEQPKDEITTTTMTTTDNTSDTCQESVDELQQTQTFEDPEHMRQDTYYARLTDIVGSRQAYLLRKLRESPLPNHPNMSPLRASDDILRQFPTTYLIVRIQTNPPS